MLIRTGAHKLLGSLLSFGRAIHDKRPRKEIDRKAHGALDNLIDLVLAVKRKPIDPGNAISLGLFADAPVPKPNKSPN